MTAAAQLPTLQQPCRLVYNSFAFICHKAAYIHGLCHSAVETLHDQLRDCVDLMGIGLGASRADTVAEEGTAITKDQPKDIGDVRSACCMYLIYTCLLTDSCA